MIAFVSIVLAAYEALALTTRRPTLTTLSTRRGTEVLVWGWFLCLGLHFLDERHKHHDDLSSKWTDFSFDWLAEDN